MSEPSEQRGGVIPRKIGTSLNVVIRNPGEGVFMDSRQQTAGMTYYILEFLERPKHLQRFFCIILAKINQD
jgi:hypothetical protein